MPNKLLEKTVKTGKPISGKPAITGKPLLTGRPANWKPVPEKTMTGKPVTKKRKPKPKSQFTSMWACLPDVVLEDVFSRLSLKDRYTASLVCSNWNRIFYSPRIWSKLSLDDRTLTRRKYNYYTGYQHVLAHDRAQSYLHRFGRNLKHLVFTPMSNFFNLYELMNMLSYFAEFFDDNPLSRVHTFSFTFACRLKHGDTSQHLIFGTGGKILQALKRLMKNLTNLRSITLCDLLLDSSEAVYLLDDVAMNCCDSLRNLQVVNCTKEPYPFLHVGVFLNIRKLVISPQHLNDDVILLLAETTLRDLYIVQTEYTEYAFPITPKVWRECKKLSPKLRVHLMIRGHVKKEILWQECAPVKSIIYDSPYSNVTTDSILMVSSLYSNELETYACLGLPKFYMPKSFSQRADSALVFLCRACSKLRTLVVRERISTSTVLLLACNAPMLERLIIRRNAVIKRFDWPRDHEWTDDFYQWIKRVSQSYELVEEEVSKILGQKWWPLSDQEFKKFVL